MLTAIAVLLLSAVGGGVVGAYLTNSYPNDAICYECKEKGVYQEDVRYDRLITDSIESKNEDGQEEHNRFLDEMESEDYENSQEGRY